VQEDLDGQVSCPLGLVGIHDLKDIHDLEDVRVYPGGLGLAPEVRGWIFFLEGDGVFEFFSVVATEEVFDVGDPQFAPGGL
jgi:hypothetical protein